VTFKISVTAKLYNKLSQYFCFYFEQTILMTTVCDDLQGICELFEQNSLIVEGSEKCFKQKREEYNIHFTPKLLPL